MPGHVLIACRAARARAATRITRVAAVASVALLAAAGLSGCYTQASAGTSIALATAYVPIPSSPGAETVAYLVIRNNGGADRLLRARTSVGGQVAIRDPEGPGSTVMHTIRSALIPANSTVRMVPDGLHLLITGARPMHGGKDITLTLVFAHAGAISVLAEVTNPQTGGSSYFVN